MYSKLPENGIEIKVPASIANLGPGFDTLAVAVRLYLHLHVTPVSGVNEVHFEFPDCKIDGEKLHRACVPLCVPTSSERPFPPCAWLCVRTFP